MGVCGWVDGWMVVVVVAARRLLLLLLLLRPPEGGAWLTWRDGFGLWVLSSEPRPQARHVLVGGAPAGLLGCWAAQAGQVTTVWHAWTIYRTHPPSSLRAAYVNCASD